MPVNFFLFSVFFFSFLLKERKEGREGKKGTYQHIGSQICKWSLFLILSCDFIPKGFAFVFFLFFVVASSKDWCPDLLLKAKDNDASDEDFNHDVSSEAYPPFTFVKSNVGGGGMEKSFWHPDSLYSPGGSATHNSSC